MSEKWTKGPWSRIKWDILGADNSRICRVVPWDESGCREDDIANAHLIAAAPEMYSAIKTHCSFCDETECGECMFAEVLKKARGES